jgi:hypothetical protein
MKRENLSRLIKATLNGAKHPRRIAEAMFQLEDELYRDQLMKRYGLPKGLPTVDLLEISPRFDETVFPYASLGGGSSVMDIALLRSLARRFERTTFFEIGTWRGESLANMAEVSAQCFSLSFSDDELRHAGWSEDFVKINRFYSQGLANVTHIGHDSKTFDFTPFVGQVDIVFIDGDHTYEGVKRDTENAFALLRDAHSIIVWHDYWYVVEQSVRWPVLAGILDGCPSAHRDKIYGVSNTLCAIFVQDAVRTHPSEFPSVPDKDFIVRIGVKSQRGGR